MNVRKLVDYSVMFEALDKLMAAEPPQMELCCEIGRLVSGRPEKGTAVAAAEYLSSAYPDATGFSPRNLRRMREFYRAYESAPEVLAQATTIGWTQNVVILEAELTTQERAWYIRAVRRFGWSKVELQRQIEAGAHRENILDMDSETCYTEEKPDNTERLDEKIEPNRASSNCICCNQHRRYDETDLFPKIAQDGPTAYPHRLRRFRPAGWDGPGQPARHGPHLRRRPEWKNTISVIRGVSHVWLEEKAESSSL